MKKVFELFAARTAAFVGSPWAFIGAVTCIGLWAVTGPIFRFSNTWQLVINTGTTIITFLMVFLIQNTQNRDAKAVHLKLDELLRASERARTALVGLEDLPDEQLAVLQRQFERLRDHRADERGAATAGCEGTGAAVKCDGVEGGTPDRAGWSERSDTRPGDSARRARRA